MTCDCCANRGTNVYQMGCPACEARMLARTIKPQRLAATTVLPSVARTWKR